MKKLEIEQAYDKASRLLIHSVAKEFFRRKYTGKSISHIYCESIEGYGRQCGSVIYRNRWKKMMDVLGFRRCYRKSNR